MDRVSVYPVCLSVPQLHPLAGRRPRLQDARLRAGRGQVPQQREMVQPHPVLLRGARLPPRLLEGRRSLRRL